MGRRRWALVLVLGFGCALASNLYAAWEYDTAPIIDQSTYRWQATELANGNLTLDAPAPNSPSPAFGVRVVDGRAIFKYMPGTAGLAAVSKILTGGFRLSAILAVTALVAGTTALARALRLPPTSAILAGALLGLSPLLLSIGSLTLSYVPAMACVVWGAAIVIREAERAQPRPVPLLLGGALFGVALFFRQVEPLLWLAITSLWLLRAHGRKPLAPVALGFGTLVAAAAITVVAITHSLQPPFLLVSPEDGFGFGGRRVGSIDPFTNFTPWRSLEASLITARAALLWGPASVVGALAAVYGYQHMAIPRRRLLVGLGAAVALTYGFHWSIANAVQNNAIEIAGPFYYLPVVVVAAVAAGHGAAQAFVAARDHRRATAVLGVLAVPGLLLALTTVHEGIDRAQGNAPRLPAEQWDSFVELAAAATDEPFVALADLSYAGDTRQVEAAEDQVPALAGTSYVRFEDPDAIWASMQSCDRCQVVLFTQRLVSRYSELLSAPTAVSLSVEGDSFSHPIHANLFGKQFDHLVLGVSFDGFFYQATEWDSTRGPDRGAVTVDGSHIVIGLGSRQVRVQPPAGASQMTIRLIATLDGEQVAVGELRTPIQRTLAGIDWVVPMQAFSGASTDSVGPFEFHLSNG